MKKILGLSLVLLGISATIAPDWGFFAHRSINEIACYTLPQELFSFFKPNIPFIKSHAVDPDMRRYSLKMEAGRHYVDIDYWGTPPYENVPRDWPSAFFKMMEINYVNGSNDTLLLKPSREAAPDSIKTLFYEKVKPHYFAAEWNLNCEDLNKYFPELNDCKDIIAVDSLTKMGILPYSLNYTYKQLVYAFESKEHQRILRHAADIGHYIGDAHVPLHTTENYNGQLTNQVGIHAFWESRLPELYAEDEYDLLTGTAQYIDDVNGYFWDIVMDTHTHVDSVLLIEQRLRDTYPSDRQYCFEERLNRTVKVECEEFAAAYHEALDGMVENQMAKTIAAVGNIWYSAWVDAGQPILDGKSASIEILADSIELEYPVNIGHH